MRILPPVLALALCATGCDEQSMQKIEPVLSALSQQSGSGCQSGYRSGGRRGGSGYGRKSGGGDAQKWVGVGIQLLAAVISKDQPQRQPPPPRVVIVRQPSREEVLEAEVERLRHENRRLKHREHDDEDF
jgi:hypothetical protein